jgi:hypothetical protein
MIRSLNITGLLLGFIGVVMIFKWGYPQPDFDPLQAQRILNTGGPDPDMLAKSAHYQMMSYFGLSFLGCGYLSQIFAALLPIHRPISSGR